VSTARPRVVIVGAGFGGLFAARALARVDCDVTLIDRHNYHLFQPLLYQVATAGLPPSDIAWPIRSLLSGQRNTVVLLGEVVGVDAAARRVRLKGRELSFDYLIVAAGATHAYFGHDAWRAHAPGLKSIDDATLIRRRILMAFETAEMATDPAKRERLLRFVIVGAGPTGVELAGTIAELARHTLARDFRHIDPRSAKVVLVEAGPRVLAAFRERQSSYAQRALEKLGVDVRVNAAVTACDGDGVTIGTERVAAATVIWAAGVAAAPVGSWLGAATDRAGRVRVGADLALLNDPAVFVIGDSALIETTTGRVPGVAPAAKQQGRYVGEVIARRLAGRPPPAPFAYKNAGNFATIGRGRAVIELPFMSLRGWLAWWLWGVAHIYFLLGVPSPLVVSLRWLWEYLTYGRGARLITGVEHAD
jgi:NADH:quinone reductase (non-electrogenic)